MVNIEHPLDKLLPLMPHFPGYNSVVELHYCNSDADRHPLLLMGLGGSSTGVKDMEIDHLPELSKLRAEHLWLKRVARDLRNNTPQHMKDVLKLLPDWHHFHVPNSLPIAIAWHKPSHVVIVSEYADFERYKAAGYTPMRLSMYQWEHPEYTLRLIKICVANAYRRMKNEN